MSFFFFKDTATTEIYTYGHTLALHDALPISRRKGFDEPRQCFPQCGLFLLVGDAQTDDCQALCRGNQYILSPVAHTGEQAGWASSGKQHLLRVCRPFLVQPDMTAITGIKRR